MLTWIKHYVIIETLAHLLGFTKLKRKRYNSCSSLSFDPDRPLTLNDIWAMSLRRRDVRSAERKLREALTPLRGTPAERIKAEYNKRIQSSAWNNGLVCDSAMFIDAEMVAAGDPGQLWLSQHIWSYDPDHYWIEYPDNPVDPFDSDTDLEPPCIGTALIDGKHYRYGETLEGY